MQPYQEAAQEIRKQGESPLNIAKGAITGAAAFLGGGAINRVLPFLSKYVPENLAIKGLNKIDPRFGSFIQKALDSGKSFDEVKEFIGSKIEGSQEPAKSNKNIIEQESPELHQFLDQEIRKGRQPIEAAALAQNDKKYSSIINKLTKIHKTPWSQIIESIFGNGQTAQANSQQGMQQQAQQMQQGQQQQMQSQPQGQGGQGQQALMAILNKINQRMGQ